MPIRIKDQSELKRIKTLLSNLNNKSVQFPVIIFTAEDQTVAFMEGRPDREFSVRSEEGKQSFAFSDREGARGEWFEKEVEGILAKNEREFNEANEDDL